jgi:hypothetical protein
MQRRYNYFSTFTLCNGFPVSQNFHDRVIVTYMIETCVRTFPSYYVALMSPEYVKGAHAETLFDCTALDFIQ